MQQLERRLPGALIARVIERYRLDESVFVTRPTLPPLNRFRECLAEIWESAWLTNNGLFHQRLERALGEYLGVEHVSLTCNGTIALLIGLRALGVTEGDVITTPFTFAGTAHALAWSGLNPVFCDIEPETLTLDAGRAEELITPATRAILPVHVYGHPCRVDELQAVADRHGLKLLYDGAHAFGVRFERRPLVANGDLTALSFHATKLFSTFEGGALISPNAELKREVDRLRNFCILDEETVVGVGINGKLNEVQCAFGLLQLEEMDGEIARRRKIALRYRSRLAALPGIECLPDPPGTEPNHSYFPVLVDARRYGLDRDELHSLLAKCNIKTRKYFHPLVSQMEPYRDLPSGQPSRIPRAEHAGCRVLCLPIYGGLDLTVVDQVADCLLAVHEAVTRGAGRA